MSEVDDKVVDEVVVQPEGIEDLIKDFVPPVSGDIENKADESIKEESVNVEEGKERPAEATGEQKPIDGAAEQKVEAQQVVDPAKPVESQVQVVPPVETDIERITKENAQLKALLEEAAGRVVGPKETKPLTEAEQKALQEQQANQARQVLQFLPNNEVFDEVMKDAKNFNALMTSVVNVAVERSLRLMPQIATQLVDQQMTLKTAVRDFYTDNKDLEQHKKYVGFVTNEIAAQHSDWGLQQILQEVEKEVRSRLKMPRSVTPVVTQDQAAAQIGNVRTAQSNPGFVPGGGGGRRGPSSSDGNLTGVEKDILGLIS